MKVCYFITGVKNSGKTTLLRALSLRGWDCLSVHDLIENGGVPDDYDEVIDDFLCREPSQICFKAVDGYPFLDEHVSYIEEIESDGWMVKVLNLTADQSILSSRNVMNPSRPTAKFNLSDRSLSSKNVTTLDTSDLSITVPTHSSEDLVMDDFITGCFNLWSAITGNSNSLPSAERMLDRMEEELGELRKSFDDGDFANVREEGADMMVFFMLFNKALGLSGRDLMSSLMNKMTVNFFRLDTKQKPYVSKLVGN